jgi:RimJ/RimL family protein N-acetyltransferase
VVRFDQNEDSAVVDIYLVPERRGQGLGTPMLDAALQWLKRNSSVRHLYADVLAENAASMRLFATAGFVTTTWRLSLDLTRP